MSCYKIPRWALQLRSDEKNKFSDVAARERRPWGLPSLLVFLPVWLSYFCFFFRIPPAPLAPGQSEKNTHSSYQVGTVSASLFSFLFQFYVPPLFVTQFRARDRLSQFSLRIARSYFLLLEAAIYLKSNVNPSLDCKSSVRSKIDMEIVFLPGIFRYWVSAFHRPAFD